MDFTTNYMGLTLKSPFVPSSGPYSEKVENLKHMEDNGAAAVVLHSIFEEQIRHEELELVHHLEKGNESFAESLSYFPELGHYKLGPEEYLTHISRCKKELGIPVIASLNGLTTGGWTSYAAKIEQAGADALECNIYFLATDPEESGAAVEQRYLEIARAVKEQVKIPVAIKLSPHFSSIAWMAKRLDEVGVDGLALFNRFYQPDIDLEELEVVPNLVLSSSWESRMVMRWIAVLHGRVRASLAATSGVHRPEDAIKLIMAGADVVHLCSTLLLNGPQAMRGIETGMRRWMEERDYESLAQMRGSMSQRNCPNPAAFERANYMKMLASHR